MLQALQRQIPHELLCSLSTGHRGEPRPQLVGNYAPLLILVILQRSAKLRVLFMGISFS